ncbi:hypothetical protein [Terrisporobacter sp.]|uniref:hypothetical protein n=1 Tax=Terrisporobacter sp. TaxID=1965305 RepID=UPI0028991FAC|nr:hypothetical protein [Terrisporobacter sp.]
MNKEELDLKMTDALHELADILDTELSEYNKLRDEMESLIECGDTENAHSRADGILCELLESLGYGKIVELYYDVDKWYA